jgi:tripeptide aminopeptidase
VAHYDAPPQARAQQPQVHNKYVSGDIVLGKDIRLTEENSPQLLNAHGHNFLTSDGSSAFGADSKAGLAIVMTLADYLLGNPALQHGLIKIVLLPDRISHTAAASLDLKTLGAHTALVLDGSDLGEIATGNFSGRNFTIVFDGRRDISLGQARSSDFSDNLLMASDFHTLLPRHARPETTSAQQGYIMVDNILTEGNRTTVTGHLRAFTDEDLQNLSSQVTRAFNAVKALYPRHTGAELTFADQFVNVQGKIPPALIQSFETALRQEDIRPKRISVRDNADFAVLTAKGLPAIGVFTGVFHGAEPLEYADVDIMEAALRALLSAVLQIRPAPEK